MIAELQLIKVTALQRPRYITTPDALASLDVFVRRNAIALISWYGVLHADLDESSEERVCFGEFAICQYQREVMLVAEGGDA